MAYLITFTKEVQPFGYETKITRWHYDQLVPLTGMIELHKDGYERPILVNISIVESIVPLEKSDAVRPRIPLTNDELIRRVLNPESDSKRLIDEAERIESENGMKI